MNTTPTNASGSRTRLSPGPGQMGARIARCALAPHFRLIHFGPPPRYDRMSVAQSRQGVLPQLHETCRLVFFHQPGSGAAPCPDGTRWLRPPSRAGSCRIVSRFLQSDASMRVTLRRKLRVPRDRPRFLEHPCPDVPLNLVGGCRASIYGGFPEQGRRFPKCSSVFGIRAPFCHLRNQDAVPPWRRW